MFLFASSPHGLSDVDGELPFGGEVEIDESLVGGTLKGTGRAYWRNKTILMAMVERYGDKITKVVPDVKRRTLEPIIKSNLVENTTVHTNELRSCMSLGGMGYDHQSVNHGAGEFVHDDCHVNSVEGFWARLKNSIRGTHVFRVLADQPHHLRPEREIGHLPELARTHLAMPVEQHEAGCALKLPGLHRAWHRAVALRIDCDGETDAPLVQEGGKAFVAVAIVMFEDAVQVSFPEALGEALRLGRPRCRSGPARR